MLGFYFVFLLRCTVCSGYVDGPALSHRLFPIAPKLGRNFPSPWTPMQPSKRGMLGNRGESSRNHNLQAKDSGLTNCHLQCYRPGKLGKSGKMKGLRSDGIFCRMSGQTTSGWWNIAATLLYYKLQQPPGFDFNKWAFWISEQRNETHKEGYGKGFVPRWHIDIKVSLPGESFLLKWSRSVTVTKDAFCK